MSRPLIRNGTLTSNPFPHGQYDVTKLDEPTALEALNVVHKAKAGKRLSAKDAAILLKARTECRTGSVDPLDRITATLRQMKGSL